MFSAVECKPQNAELCHLAKEKFAAFKESRHKLKSGAERSLFKWRNKISHPSSVQHWCVCSSTLAAHQPCVQQAAARKWCTATTT